MIYRKIQEQIVWRMKMSLEGLHITWGSVPEMLGMWCHVGQCDVRIRVNMYNNGRLGAGTWGSPMN